LAPGHLKAATVELIVDKRTEHGIVLNGEYAGAMNDCGIHWRLRLILRPRLLKIARLGAMATGRPTAQDWSLTARFAGITRAQVATLRKLPRVLCIENRQPWRRSCFGPGSVTAIAGEKSVLNKLGIKGR